MRRRGAHLKLLGPFIHGAARLIRRRLQFEVQQSVVRSVGLLEARAVDLVDHGLGKVGDEKEGFMRKQRSA